MFRITLIFSLNLEIYRQAHFPLNSRCRHLLDSYLYFWNIPQKHRLSLWGSNVSNSCIASQKTGFFQRGVFGGYINGVLPLLQQIGGVKSTCRIIYMSPEKKCLYSSPFINILYLIALLKTSESLALWKSLAKFPLTSVGPVLLTLPYKENPDCLGSWPASAKTSVQTAYKLNWLCTITKAVILENLPNPQDKTSIINYPQTFTLE